MGFSDIQKDPRNYDKDTLVDKLENYFTATLENCPFIDQLDKPWVKLTLTEETVQPVTIPVYVKRDTEQTTARVPKQHVVDLYHGTLWGEAPAFTTDFLQAVMCGLAHNEQFQKQFVTPSPHTRLKR